MSPYTFDIDVGGTFTDGYVTRGDEIRTVKVFTTPHDLTVGVVDCIRQGAAAFGVTERSLAQDTVVIRLSTTIGTNTLVQRRGPRIGVIVSKGSEDFLYNPDRQRIIPQNLLDPAMVQGIEGAEETAVLNAVRELLAGGARTIVVALRGAGEDTTAERSARRIIRERYPEHYLTHVPVQIATDVTEIPEDHLRLNTAILNGYLHRDMARTLYKVEDWLRSQGCRPPLRIVHASGGVARVAKTKAIHTYSSGPTAALVGARAIARLYGFSAAVGADMGGTTLDIGLVGSEDLTFNVTPNVAGIPIGMPMIETVSLGIGGGSIAASSEHGSLSIGPTSAGAVPGPACYGKGGTDATVTDADVSAGIVDPSYFLGGRFRLFPDKASEALTQHVATPLGLSHDEAALRVREETDQLIGNTIESLVKERGWRPSELVLLAYGGAGPVHAVGMAAAAGIKTVMMFAFGGVFSAFGMSHMDVSHIYTRTQPFVLFDPKTETYCNDLEAFNFAVREMTKRALSDMRGEGFGGTDDITFELDVLIREEGMARKTMVRSPALALRTVADVQMLCDRFRAQMPLEKGRRRTVLETLVLKATAATLHKPLPEHSISTAISSSARKSGRQVLWSRADGFREAAVYDLARLQSGNRIDGPAIVEAEDTVCPVPPGATFSLDKHRTGVITLNA